MPSQQVPEGRYGPRRGRPRRWLRWLLVAAAVALCVTATVVGYNNLGNAPIHGKATAFKVLNDHSVRITLRVRRDNAHQPAVCVVRTRALSGREVGRREVYIPPVTDDHNAPDRTSGGQAALHTATTYHRTVVTASARPATGEVFGCSYNVPAYLVPAYLPQ